ncbi:hypothetical protein LXA43DRAFT_894290 [Ganoderma leucocontextum]|nr:hypothetical protein LXA43DRAFT_894290 [Ganoderma leucocontextum]
MVVEQDDDEEEEEEEEAEEEGSSSSDDDDDGYANDGDNLSTEAVDELMRVIRLSKKKKKKRCNPDKPPGHFQKWGRHAHRLCGVYTDIYNTITTGMTVIGADPKTAEDYQTCFKAVPSMSAATAKFYTKKFLHLVEQVPKFKSLCGHLLSRPGDMFVFARFFAKHAAAGRSTDLSTIKRNFHDYLPTVTVPSGEVIAPLTHAQAILKSRNGGYWSQCTGRLVVPIEEHNAYDEDPRGYSHMLIELRYCRSKISRHKSDAIDGIRRRKRHQNDRPKVNPNLSYPSYLFQNEQDYEDARPQRGIFKSDLCLAGPGTVSLAPGADGLGSKCIADLYNITHLTPDYLAYAATLIRHLLSVDGRLQGDDKQRTGHRLHTSLHRLLTVDYQAWELDAESSDLEEFARPDLLDENIFAFYNRWVFGSEIGDPVQQAREGSVYNEDADDGNIRGRILNAREEELKEEHRRRRQAKYRPPSEWRAMPEPRASSEHPQYQAPRASSLEYVDPRPATPVPDGAQRDPDADANADAQHANANLGDEDVGMSDG